MIFPSRRSHFVRNQSIRSGSIRNSQKRFGNTHEEHTFLGPDLLQLLGHGGENPPATSTMLSLDDLEELIGCISFEANHTDDRRLRKRLDQLFAHLQGVLDSYVDIYED